MKKEYVKPLIEVYRLQVQGQLLDFSGGGLGAREFDDIWEEEADDLEP